MYFMYIDESGNTGTDYGNTQQPFLTMCGVIVKDTDWIDVDNHVSELKKDLFGTDVEIHASLMINPRKNTPFWGKKSREENYSSVESIVDLMLNLPITLMSCNIRKSAFKAYLGRDIKVDPYYLGLIYLSYYFNRFLIDIEDIGVIVTDWIDTIDEKTTYNIMNILRLDEQFNNIIERPLRTDSTLCNFVQFADMAAYHFNRYHTIKENGYDANNPKNAHIIKMREKLRSIYARNSIAKGIKGDISSKFMELINEDVIKIMGE